MKEKFMQISCKYHDSIIKTASELIQINSQSLHEKKVAEYTKKKMQELGYDEVLTDRYGSVFGIMRGTGGGSSVNLNCHLDVVYESDPGKWPYPPFSGKVADGKIWGRGASDTKGTFALQLYIPKMLKEIGLLPKGDIVVSGVVSEEIAGFGSMMQVKDGFMLCDYVIIGEASENDLAVSCRGRFACEVTIKGKSCHASIPHEGKNPFDMLGNFLVKLKSMPLGEDEIMGKSTMSVTNISSSEQGTNIIPNEVKLFIDYRQVPCDTTEIVVEKIKKIALQCLLDGLSVEVKPYYFPLTTYTGFKGQGFQGEPPFSVSKDDEFVLFAKKLIENVADRKIKLKNWAFATDAGHFSGAGCKVLGYSPAEIKYCHTTQDCIDINMIKEAELGLLALTYGLANKDKK